MSKSKYNEMTFEDFQKRKEEQLQKMREIKEKAEQEEEEKVSYPEIFAFERPRWLI